MLRPTTGLRHLKFTLGFVLGLAAAQGLGKAVAEPPATLPSVELARARVAIPLPRTEDPSAAVRQALADLESGSPFRALAPRTLLEAGHPRLAEVLGPYARATADDPQEERLLALSVVSVLAREGGVASRRVIEEVALDAKAGSLRIMAVISLGRMGADPSRAVLRKVLGSALVLGDGTLEEAALVALDEIPAPDGFAS